MIDPTTVVFTTRTGIAAVSAILDDQDTPVSLTGGQATYTVTPRTQRKSLTEFAGVDPYTQTFAATLGSVIAGRSIESDIANLLRMCQQPDDSTSAGPLVTVSGPLPKTDVDWTMQVTLGECVRDRRVGNERVQQEVAVTLLEWVDSILVFNPSQNLQVSNPIQSWHWLVTKQGDTVQKIAARVAPKKATRSQIAQLVLAIRTMNNLRAAKTSVYPKPKRLKIPNDWTH